MLVFLLYLKLFTKTVWKASLDILMVAGCGGFAYW